MEESKQLNIKKELDELRDMYNQDIAQDSFNALIVGRHGVGKTQLALTCRKPVLIHSFDPGGTKHLRPEISKGEIIVDTRYENEDSRRPQAYKAWEKEFDRLRKSGIFEGIGTYILDSLTTWTRALYNQIAKKGKFSSDGVLEIKGWAILGNTLRDMTKLVLSLPCDTILTGHTEREKDDVSGKMIVGLAATPSIRSNLPILFDEYYCMVPNPSDNNKRNLLTSSTARRDAKTRIGRDKFKQYEKPNIKYLLKKAGYSVEDKE